jgi:membrane protein implicated in regulation of membrane protease activity
MSPFFDFFAAHAMLGWLAVGAALLCVELATGSGWLLWPAGSAALTGLVTLFLNADLTTQAGVFALLTIVSTFAGRRFINRGDRRGHDPNDPHARLIGHSGQAASDFEGGKGRVFVDGKEWSAELDGDGAVTSGTRVKVIALIGGARLKVRLA